MDTMLGSPRDDLFGITKDFIQKLGNGTISPMQAKRFLRKENPFAGPSMELPDQLTRWQTLFDSANIDCDVSQVTIPEQQPGFDRLIIIPKGLTLNRLVEIMRKRFDMWLYTDNPDKMITSDRSNKKTAYAIWMRDNVEADKEYKSMSADEIANRGIIGITVLERLLYELVYFDETEGHLDIKNHTLCTGSRDVNGIIPVVNYSLHFRGMCVGFCYRDSSDSEHRARAVIS